jgi:hypothetical protein
VHSRTIRTPTPYYRTNVTYPPSTHTPPGGGSGDGEVDGGALGRVPGGGSEVGGRRRGRRQGPGGVPGRGGDEVEGSPAAARCDQVPLRSRPGPFGDAGGEGTLYGRYTETGRRRWSFLAPNRCTRNTRPNRFGGYMRGRKKPEAIEGN